MLIVSVQMVGCMIQGKPHKIFTFVPEVLNSRHLSDQFVSVKFKIITTTNGTRKDYLTLSILTHSQCTIYEEEKEVLITEPWPWSHFLQVSYVLWDEHVVIRSDRTSRFPLQKDCMYKCNYQCPQEWFVWFDLLHNNC